MSRQISDSFGVERLGALEFEPSDSKLARPTPRNLPGWRWAAITKVALDRLSRSLHSDVCDSDGCCDAVVHSTISGSGNRRTRAVPNYATITFFEEIILHLLSHSCNMRWAQTDSNRVVRF